MDRQIFPYLFCSQCLLRIYPLKIQSLTVFKSCLTKFFLKLSLTCKEGRHIPSQGLQVVEMYSVQVSDLF